MKVYEGLDNFDNIIICKGWSWKIMKFDVLTLEE